MTDSKTSGDATAAAASSEAKSGLEIRPAAELHKGGSVNPKTITATVTLNDGRKMPRFGLGVYQSRPGDEAYKAVRFALEAGYRHIDTAALYGNEEDVGRAVRDSGIPREQVWITTKLWNSDGGYERAIAACKDSLRKLQMDYVDLYLIHSPVKSTRLDSWRALEHLQATGLAKSIGISNYGVAHMEELFKVAKVKPAVNQVELHPFLTRDDIVAFCEGNGIVLEAYAPLTQGRKLDDPRVVSLAKKYRKTAAQVLIRWSLQRGFVSIPKSVHQERIVENAAVFDFDISADDMALLSGCDEYFTTCWDPTVKP